MPNYFALGPDLPANWDTQAGLRLVDADDPARGESPPMASDAFLVLNGGQAPVCMARVTVGAGGMSGG